jgi:predicted Rossmann fold nucleotide-binding protein DprA/Smf involved in DNA uptake
MILFGQSPAPTSDALPRRTYCMESDEDSEVERMTKRDIEQVVLDMLPAEPGASTTALSQTAGISSDRVFRVLLKLEKDGKVRREEIPHGQVVVKRWFMR